MHTSLCANGDADTEKNDEQSNRNSLGRCGALSLVSCGTDGEKEHHGADEL